MGELYTRIIRKPNIGINLNLVPESSSNWFMGLNYFHQDNVAALTKIK